MQLTTPLTDADIFRLHSGDRVVFNGIIYVARDSAHKRMIESLQRGEPLPFDVHGQTIYYMGPSPAKPGQVIGSAGPTTSTRMDRYAPSLIERGLKGMIGKGARAAAVKEAMKKHGAVYFAAISGAGALIAQRIVQAETVAYEDLGAEALLRLVVKDFPVVVVNDVYGGDLYDEGKAKYAQAANGISAS